MPRLPLILAILLLAAMPAFSQDLAPTPPMGWNSWDSWGMSIDEAGVRAEADYMAQHLKSYGWQYVVIDEGWFIPKQAGAPFTLTPNGQFTPSPDRYPSAANGAGLKPLGDYVHSLGLKFGIYSDAGTQTCQHRPGTRGYEYQDARQYAAWGVDYLKFDWCSHTTQDAPSSYALKADALKVSGRPIVFSLCEWGSSKPWLWAGEVGNLWRTTGDIQDIWAGKGKEYGLGVMDIVDLQVTLGSYAGPGHWNDPDMLEVGNGGLTETENRSHFSLWAILAAPLMAGNDLDAMTPAIHDILTNKEVIAVDQDALCLEGRRVRHGEDGDVWVKELSDGSRAVVLLNRGTADQTINVTWEELGYPAHLEAAVRDLWAHKDLGKFTGSFSAPVASHAVAMITIKP